MSYDDRQVAARLVMWLCCRRTVYAVHPNSGWRGVRVTTPRLPFWEQTAFEKYHNANPHVLIALERFTREAFEAGHAHIGIDFCARQSPVVYEHRDLTITVLR